MFRNSTGLRVCAALALAGLMTVAGRPGCTPAANSGGGATAAGPSLPTFDDLLALAARLGFTEIQARGVDADGNALAVVYPPAGTDPEAVAVAMMREGTGTVARAIGAPGSITGWDLYYSATAAMATLSADAITLGDGTVIPYADASTPDSGPGPNDTGEAGTLKATLTVTRDTTVDLAADAVRELSCIASGGTSPYSVGLEHESGPALARFEERQLVNRVDATVEFTAPTGTHNFLCVVVDSAGSAASDRLDLEVTGQAGGASSTTQPDPDAARAQTGDSLACPENGRSVAPSAESLAKALFSCAASSFDAEDSGRDGFTQRFGDCIAAFPAAVAYGALENLTAGLVACCPPRLTIGEHTSCLNVGESTAFTAVVEASSRACPWDVRHFLDNPSPDIVSSAFDERTPSGTPPRFESDVTLVGMARGTVDLDDQVWVAFGGNAGPHVRSDVRVTVAACDTCQTLDREVCACVGDPCPADSPDAQPPDSGSTPDGCLFNGTWAEIGTDRRWTIADGHLLRVDLVPERDNGMACQYQPEGNGRSTLVRETPSTEGETFNCNTPIEVTCTGDTGTIVGYESFPIAFQIVEDTLVLSTPGGAVLSRWARQ